MKENWRCDWFGHKLQHAHAEPRVLFGELSLPHYDGMQSAHRQLYVRCYRCERRVLVARTIDGLISGDRRIG